MANSHRRLFARLFSFLAVGAVALAQTFGDGGLIVGQATKSISAAGSVTKNGYNPTTGFVTFTVSSFCMLTDSANGQSDQIQSRISIPGVGNFEGTKSVEIGPDNTITFDLQVNFVNWTNASALLGRSGSTLTISVQPPKKGIFQTQRANYDLTYRFYDKVTGKLIATKKVPAGESWAFNVESPDGNPISWTSTRDGYVWDGTKWVESDTQSAIVASGTIPPSSMVNAVGGVSGVNQTAPVATPENTVRTTTGYSDVYIDGKGSVTPSGDRFLVKPSDATANPTGAADNQTLIKGANITANAIGVTGAETVSKLEELRKAVIANKPTSGGGSGGSGGAVTVNFNDAALVAGINNLKGSVDGIGTSVTSIVNELDRRKQKEEEMATAVSEAVATQGTAGQAAATAQSAILNAQGNLSTPAGEPGTGDWLAALDAVSLPAKFGGKSFKLGKPVRDNLLPILHAFRTALGILVLVKLAQSLWQDVGTWARGFSVVPQAHGNTVAGSGGQISGTVAAAAITVAITTGLTALVGWGFGDLSFAVLKGVSTSHPFAEFPTLVYSMLRDVFPVQLIWTALLAKLSFGMYAAALFASVSSVIRYINP